MAGQSPREHTLTQTELDNFDNQAQSDLNQMQHNQEEFFKDAPNMGFNLPFGLGKLFGLPGEKEDEQRREAEKAQEEADRQAAEGPHKS
jgi:hypothetical protein